MEYRVTLEVSIATFRRVTTTFGATLLSHQYTRTQLRSQVEAVLRLVIVHEPWMEKVQGESL